MDVVGGDGRPGGAGAEGHAAALATPVRPGAGRATGLACAAALLVGVTACLLLPALAPVPVRWLCLLGGAVAWVRPWRGRALSRPLAVSILTASRVTGPWLWSTTPTRSAASGTFTQLSVGGGHTCALRSDGVIECWGSNQFGQAPLTRSASSGATCSSRAIGGSSMALPPPALRNASCSARAARRFRQPFLGRRQPPHRERPPRALATAAPRDRLCLRVLDRGGIRCVCC